MKLRLKENPREWRKFAFSSAIVLALIAGLLWWRNVLSANAVWTLLASLALAALAAAIRPRWFRGPYRVGMRVSFVLGQLVGRVLLTLIFFAVLTPLGLVLRLAGKDPLQLRRKAKSSSYWQPVSGSDDLSKMF